MDSTTPNDVQVMAPPGFMSNIPDVNAVSDLRIKLIKYIASPFVHQPEIDKYIDGPVVDF